MLAEKKSARNWFWRQNPGQMSPDSTSSEDYDFETAVAAGAFAAATFKEAEAEIEPEPEASQTKNKRTGDGRGGPPESSKISEHFTVKQEKQPAGNYQTWGICDSVLSTFIQTTI